MNKLTRIGMAKGPVRLGTWRKVTVYAVSAGLWASGAVWLIFHYFLRAPSEFGPTPNPLEPWWLKLHGAFAFAALWMFGLLCAAHVGNGWTSGRRRWSGALTLGVAAILGLSAYFLYYVGDDGLRQAAAYVHWILGLGTPVLLIWHRVVDVAIERRKAAAKIRFEHLLPVSLRRFFGASPDRKRPKAWILPAWKQSPGNNSRKPAPQDGHDD